MNTLRTRIFAIAMTVVLSVPLTVGCIGCGNNGEKNLGEFKAGVKNGEIDLPQAGIKVTLPDALKDQQDKIAGSCYVDRAMISALIYMIDEKDSEKNDHVLLQIMAYRDDLSNEELMGDDPSVSENVIADLGNNGSFYYKGLRLDVAYEEDPTLLDPCMAGLDEDRKAQYIDMLSCSSELADGTEILPVNIPEPPKITELDSAKIMEYSMQDIDGNDVRLGDLIAANKVTMLNFWGVGCGPCIEEMPGLERLYQEHKDQGFTIIGITTDIVRSDGSFADDAIDEAKSIRKDTKVTYPLLMCPLDILNETKIAATPTTYFVDSNGTILESVMGSRTEGSWEDMLEKHLQNVQ